MKKITFIAVTAGLLTTSTANAFDDIYTVGIMAGTTGAGLEASWRFHQNFSVTANYAGGLSYDSEYDTDEVDYDGDIDLQAGAVKFDYFPFGGRFYLTAGAALPDMTASVTGTPNVGGTYDFNGNTYTAANVGSVTGELTIADSVQPYLGLGWRSSNKTGFGFFSELGVFSTDIQVDLSTSTGLENNWPALQSDIRAEEERLEEDADALSVYPVATFGVSYTF
ncbi:hypothetical protein QC823_15920 [Halomonas vilamensis]|uniref:Uncharacterized protein n=1 Tax=Vreelandella vilamensis TaxID=531309 RepID=A0ABU1H826_9GAMM|nr:hypothetical protein [Halomonas vilamensis]MDR5900451.1 hypothetical protein [Halomonas vilamensis]